MHIRNTHKSRYNLQELSRISPELSFHIFKNPSGEETIDFSNPKAVKLLNQALLKKYYHIKWWDIPPNYLCPPIPGRADTIHHLADLLAGSNGGIIPRDALAWDIGVGANCVYPIIGQHEYQWNFIGSEINEEAFDSAQKIVRENSLEKKIELRFQADFNCLLKNLLKPSELIDVTLCNPPFHSSAEEAMRGSNRKLKNLGLKRNTLNFGGKDHELWFPGGEAAFVIRLIEESVTFKEQCLWFSSLISKKENLPILKNCLSKNKAHEVKIIEMGQGQKISRILVWTYMTSDHHREWARKRWS